MHVLDIFCLVDQFFFLLTAGGGRGYSFYYDTVYPVLSRVTTWWVHLFLKAKIPSIDGIAENLVIPATSERDQIEILFNYVVKRVKRLPIRGWLSPEEIHYLMYGDCKHTSILLSTFLKHIGKDSTVVEGFTNWKGVFTKNRVERPRLHVWVRIDASVTYICDPSLNYFGSENGFEELVNGYKELYYLETVKVTKGRTRKIKGRRLYIEQQ